MNQLIITAFLSVILTGFIADTCAQSTGMVNYKYLGIGFTIPQGWFGQEVEGGYLIGSHTEPGFALITTHQAKTMEEIRMQGKQGIVADNGTNLQLAEEPEKVGEIGLGSQFKGTLEGQSVTAYVIGLLNPYGEGVSILTATTPDKYSETHKRLALQLASSMVFSKPEVLPVTAQWKEKFSNARLTYMDSYSSSSSGYNGYSTGGGYSSETQIHLCDQGYFKYKSSSSISIDTGGAFGSSHGNSNGDGTWEITGNQNAEPVLRLNFNNGEVYEYVLTSMENKTYLNDQRYFVTYGNDMPEYRPDCF